MYASDLKSAIGPYFERRNVLLEEQNRKLDDLTAAVLTLASVEQRKLHITHSAESDDVIGSFSIIRELLEGRK